MPEIIRRKQRRVSPLIYDRNHKLIVNHVFIQTLYRRLCEGDLQYLTPAFGQALPLCLRVHKDLPKRLKLKQRWPDMNKAHRSQVIAGLLRIHAHRPEYLKAVAAPNSQRHDLTGKPIEPVSAEHRAYVQSLMPRKRA